MGTYIVYVYMCVYIYVCVCVCVHIYPWAIISWLLTKGRNNFIQGPKINTYLKTLSMMYHSPLINLHNYLAQTETNDNFPDLIL